MESGRLGEGLWDVDRSARPKKGFTIISCQFQSIWHTHEEVGYGIHYPQFRKSIIGKAKLTNVP